ILPWLVLMHLGPYGFADDGSGPENLPPEPPPRTTVFDDGRFLTDDAGRAVDGQVVSPSPQDDRTIVAILPDRTTGEDWGLPHLARAVEDLNLLKPDAVFCVGDLVQGYTRDPETWDAEVDDYLSRVNGLEADFWPTAGNHDVISGARDPSDRRFADRYRARFGPLYYAVALEHGTVVVLFSDENLDGGKVDISERQLRWLEQVLGAAPSDRPVVLLMHRPLWRYEDVEWNRRVHPMLVEHGVDAVIAGHFHALHRDDDRDGIQYHLLGVCGGAIDQHPLTGQFNHLTLLDLGPKDRIHVRHLPAGVMLPDDFIVREDQDRAYRLKSGGTVKVQGSLPDPWLDEVDAEVRIEVRNPLDRPIRCTVEPASEPRPWLVEGHAFLARTEADIANPATTDLDTPFRLESPGGTVVPAGETVSIPLRLTAARTATPPPPPEVRVRLEFEDSKGRSVPIVLPRRIPVGRDDSNPADARPDWPIAAWSHSVYEEREPLGSLRTRAVTDAEERRLEIELEIFDDALTADGEADTITARSHRNPRGDLVRVSVATSAGERRFLVEPPSPGERFVPILEIDGRRLRATFADAAEWTLERTGDPSSHRLRIVIPEIDAESIRGIQVEVADNDRTYHTQWRSLAPKGRFLVLDWGTP
ncbi:MAG: metallophosphoesterase, partial [Planctomycetota bacterium]|nr:metallophosphoesterase [Planctomycetota bacterium]